MPDLLGESWTDPAGHRLNSQGVLLTHRPQVQPKLARNSSHGTLINETGGLEENNIRDLHHWNALHWTGCPRPG